MVKKDLVHFPIAPGEKKGGVLRIQSVKQNNRLDEKNKKNMQHPSSNIV